ncbi:MAG: hypothetical protein ABIG93_01655 [archaeon]|nr:hypothetical protein [Nanoarchaeota archaeon]
MFDKQKIKFNSKKLLILPIIFVLIFSLVPQQAEAGFLDPILDPISEFFQDLGDQIQDELDNTRIGRELNRVIEDVEAVAEIVIEFNNLLTLASSVTTPAGIIVLAVEYGHDPDAVFDRFKERIDTLQNNNPGGGGGPGGALTENEIAATLQIVLEEPPLPEGVYMGDECIIDFTNCPDESTNSQPRHRAYYWDYSCYADGIVGKKKINGMNKAVCQVSWVNTWRGENTLVQFPTNSQDGTYEWEQCPTTYLTQQDKDQFLATRDQVCQQPIAKHDLGDVCAVDYTSCGYGAYGDYNANRIGTINYGVVINQNFQYRREYACEVTTGSYALKPELRDSCSTVYVGDREVAEFIAANPEPTQLPSAGQQNQQQGPSTSGQNQQQGSQTPPSMEGFRFNRNLGFVVQHLGDIPFEQQEEEEELPPMEVFDKDSTVVDLGPKNVKEKKQETKQKLQQYDAFTETKIDGLRDSMLGQQLPDTLSMVMKNERIIFRISLDYDDDLVYCTVINEGIVEQFDSCSGDSSFEPTVYIYTSQSVLEELEKDPSIITEALDDGRIVIKAVGTMKKIKFGISSFFLGLVN